MGIVYAPQSPMRQLDLTGVLRFGTRLEFILHNNQAAALLDMRNTTALIEAGIREYTSEDWLLPVGSPELISIMTYYAAIYNNDRVNILHWDNHLRKYIPLEIQL